MFWFTFGFFGLLCVPLIIMFLICGADRKHKFGGAIAVIVFWVAFSGGLWLDGKGKADKWNNGYCECGAHWELRGATKSRNGVETKYYVCKNCYKEIQI